MQHRASDELLKESKRLGSERIHVRGGALHDVVHEVDHGGRHITPQAVVVESVRRSAAVFDLYRDDSRVANDPLREAIRGQQPLTS